MAVKRPSFLKKLKEQARKARADQKRETRRAKKLAKDTLPEDASSEDDLSLIEPLEEGSPEGETSEREDSAS
jgi:hypothetical protein